MIRKQSYNNERPITPLPYIEPINPRASFSKQVQQSTYLFPKSLSNPRMNNINNSNELYTAAFDDEIRPHSNDILINKGKKHPSDERSQPPDEHQQYLVTYEKNNINTSNKNIKKKKKKSVKFCNPSLLTTIHKIHFEYSTHDKSNIWYTEKEYDHFKYQAAKSAGVKLVQAYDDSEVGKTYHFVMCGDFDKKEDDVQDTSDSLGCNEIISNSGSVSSLNTNDITVPCDNTTRNKTTYYYYNENEYKDGHSSTTDNTVIGGNEENVCKRGLGFHFSRTRKKSRIVTRSAVMAWQQALRGSSSSNNNQHHPTTSLHNTITTNDKLERPDKSLMMLALVSTKCSRVAREEAKWRGNVDYIVAYPDRKEELSSAMATAADMTSTYQSGVSCLLNANNKKRASPMDEYANGNSCSKISKRQRQHALHCDSKVNGHGDDDAEGHLSPETIGYLVKYAEV